MKKRDDYIESLAAELKQWSAQINQLTARTEQAAVDVKHRYLKELDSLRAKQHAASLKMQELEESSGDAWETVKQTADNVWDDLRDGMAGVSSKFK